MKKISAPRIFKSKAVRIYFFVLILFFAVGVVVYSFYSASPVFFLSIFVRTQTYSAQRTETPVLSPVESTSIWADAKPTTVPLTKLPDNYNSISNKLGQGFTAEQRTLLLRNGSYSIRIEGGDWSNLYSKLLTSDVPVSLGNSFFLEYLAAIRNYLIKMSTETNLENKVIDAQLACATELAQGGSTEFMQLAKNDVTYLSIEKKLLNPDYVLPAEIQKTYDSQQLAASARRNDVRARLWTKSFFSNQDISDSVRQMIILSDCLKNSGLDGDLASNSMLKEALNTYSNDINYSQIDNEFLNTYQGEFNIYNLPQTEIKENLLAIVRSQLANIDSDKIDNITFTKPGESVTVDLGTNLSSQLYTGLFSTTVSDTGSLKLDLVNWIKLQENEVPVVDVQTYAPIEYKDTQKITINSEPALIEKFTQIVSDYDQLVSSNKQFDSNTKTRVSTTKAYLTNLLDLAGKKRNSKLSSDETKQLLAIINDMQSYAAENPSTLISSGVRDSSNILKYYITEAPEVVVSQVKIDDADTLVAEIQNPLYEFEVKPDEKSPAFDFSKLKEEGKLTIPAWLNATVNNNNFDEPTGYAKPPQPAGMTFIPIFMYHQIATPPTNSSQKGLYVSPEGFEQQMAYLAANNYKTITPKELYDLLVAGKNPSQKSVMLTFDDGNYNQYSVAYPIMKKYGFTGVFYIISQRSGIPVAALKEMSDNGMVIDSHTATHRLIGSETDPGVLYAQITASKGQLEAVTGKPIYSIAYPGCVASSNAIGVTSGSYLIGVSCGESGYLSYRSRLYLPRIHVFDEIESFKKACSGRLEKPAGY